MKKEREKAMNIMRLDNIVYDYSEIHHFLSCDIYLNNKILLSLRYTIEKKYVPRINITAEPFIFPAILLAISNNADLVINGKCTKRLFYGIKEFILKFWQRAGIIVPQFSITELIDELPSSSVGIATGISGGIDSFYTISSNIQCKNKLQLTHLLYIHSDNWKYTNIDDINCIKDISAKLNLPLVVISSNIVSHMKQSFEQIHTFVNFSHAVLLKPVLKTYFYSSAFTLNQSMGNLSDSGYYDLLNAQALSSTSFEFISYSPLVNRIEKTEAIADFQIAQQYLHVCLKNNMNKQNCTIYCEKCQRTLLSLVIMKKAYLFNKCFNMELFEKSKIRMFGDMLYRGKINKNHFYVDLLSYAKRNNFKIPYKSYYYFLKILIKSCIKKITFFIK